MMFSSTTIQSPEQSRHSNSMQQRSMNRNRKRDHTISRSMAQAAAAANDLNDQRSTTSERRRNMSFMKYSSSHGSSSLHRNEEQRTSTTNMHRTREHAKQIAMAISNDDILSTSTSFADFHSAFGGVQGSTTTTTKKQPQQQHEEDLFANFHQQQQQYDMSERSVTESTTHSHADVDFFQGDPFSPDYHNNKSKQQQSSSSFSNRNNISTTGNNSRRNTIKQRLATSKATNTGLFDSDSSSRSDPPLENISSNEIDWPTQHRSNDNSSTVVRVSAITASPVVRKAPNSTASSSSGGGGYITKATATKLIHRQQQQKPISSSAPDVHTPDRSMSSQQQRYTHPNISPVVGPSHNNSSNASVGAAARRLMRQQLRKGGVEENVHSTTSNSGASVYGLKRTDSTSSSKGSNSNAYTSKSTDHVALYSNTHHGTNKQHQQMSNYVAPPAAHYHHRSSIPSESSDNSSTNRDVNLFETNGNKTGFSFDAFGLDSDAMQREVNEAMNDLAGSHPSIVSQLFIQDPKDDFAFGRWDDQQSNSSVNNNSETISTGTDEQQNGYVDGFRVATATNLLNMPLHHVRESPTRSEKSSLTSESLEQHHNNASSINIFKQQAGFHASNKPRKVVRPETTTTQSQPSNNHPVRTSPRSLLQKQQTPKLDAHISKTAMQLSPPRGSNLHQRRDLVEFYGEESSTDDDNVNSVLHKSTIPKPSGGERFASDAGVGSDFDLPSDVGVSSEVGAPHSDIGHLPFIDIREKEKKVYTRRSSPSVRTESTSATTTAADEKKEEESQGVSTVGNLRSQWEKREKSIMREANQKLIQRQNVPSALSREHIERLQNQLGDVILSPELLTSTHSEYFDEPKIVRSEDSVQRQRALECVNQRTSLSSVKERLKSTAGSRPDDDRRKSKSEGGAAIRHNSVNSILSNLQRNGLVVDSRLDSPFTDPNKGRLVNPARQPWSPSSNGRYSEAQGSGVESQAMKLVRQQGEKIDSPGKRRTPTSRNTPSNEEKVNSPSRPFPSRRSASPTVHKEEEFDRTNKIIESIIDPISSPKNTQPPKQLTYRERRELELQQQREEEEQRRAQDKVNQPEKKDVSALIRQRIASNKKNLPNASSLPNDSNEQPLDLSSLRTKLRPTPIEVTHEQTSDPLHLDDMPTENENRRKSGPVDREMGTNAQFNVFPPIQSDHSQSEPTVASNQISSPKASDLVIEDDEMEMQAPNTASRVKASAAVSHMLMLQQLQQRQPKKAPPTIDIAELSTKSSTPKHAASTGCNVENSSAHDEQKPKTPKATMMMLNAFLAGRESLMVSEKQGVPQIQRSRSEDEPMDGPSEGPTSSSSVCALKDDPKYARYFKMLSIGMPMEVVKHAMTRDGLDASVMDGDHNKPVGIPLKDDPEFSKYFRMLKIGLPMEAVKHAMERDGLDSAIMDQDHDLPVSSGKQAVADAPKEQDSHRRARLHWKTLRKVTSNSLWAQINEDNDLNIEIDEEEFQGLFQADKGESNVVVAPTTVSQKRGSSVCVIDSKRANNGGIILARLKMSHDDLADAVDRIDERNLTGEQIENIIEYLPSKDERKALESYMLEGGQDAAEKFDGLCECEKFMVSMMTVKHAKRKVSALLFKLQFESCIQDIQKEACAIEQACEELSSSVRLRQLLGIVLTFGNRLNTAGNGKNKAGAFTLDSLLKLNQAKAFDKKTTFLHYIILIVQRNNELLLNFKDDLPTVFTSEKIFWDQCVTDLEEVENQLENVRKMALYQAHQAQAYRLRRKSKKDDPDESLSDTDEVLTLEEEVEALRSTPIGLFTLSAIKYVSALRDNVENTKAKFARLLEYFGEEEKQLQPHELFSIIVSFSRDFDKAKEQVLANEKMKQREERKRQTTPGKPNANSPNPSIKKSGGLKSSNMQPNMSAILNELKSNGKRITESDTEPNLQSPPVKNSLMQNSLNGQDRRSFSVNTKTPPQHIQQQNHYAYNSNQRTTSSERPRTAVSPIPSPQYIVDTSARSIPIASHTPDPQKLESLNTTRKSPSIGQSKSLHGAVSSSEDTNYYDDNASQVTTETVNSSASTSSIAMRAKARMRKQRIEQRQLPSIPTMMPNEKSTAVANSAPNSRLIVDTNNPSEPIQPSPRANNGPSSQLSPRSNIRMKRRAEIKNKARRSSHTNSANVQL